MGWRCVWVRRQLPLYVGDDLSEQEVVCIEAHLSLCRNCQAHRDSLQRSHRVMIECRSNSGETDAPSAWPVIRASLMSGTCRQESRPNWLPLGAMVAACIAIGVVLWHRPARVSVEPVATSGSVRGAIPARAEWEPDWANGLSSPAIQSYPDAFGWSGAMDRFDPHFHLERAVPAVRSGGDF
jgi:hypothetical protein